MSVPWHYVTEGVSDVSVLPLVDYLKTACPAEAQYDGFLADLKEAVTGFRLGSGKIAPSRK